MKLFKKMFGSQPKKISKYESNTLAEINESPDLRVEKEEEGVLPVEKPTAEKKSTKATKVSTSKTVSTTTKAKTTTANKENQVTKATAKSKTKADNDKPTSSTSSTRATSGKSSTKAENTTVKPTTKKSNHPTKTTTSKSANDTNITIKSKEKVTNNAVKKEDASAESKPANQTAEEITEKSPTENEMDKTQRSGKFEIKKSKDGRYVFNLYASNNVIVATSQVYSSSTAAMNGIKSVIANAATAPIDDQTLKAIKAIPYPKWEIYRDKSEHYRFRLCASNGSCVCHSQGYTAKTNCKKGIESIIRCSAGAEITKAYINKDK